MIRSGLDWSGDPGDPGKSDASARLVIAIASGADGAVADLVEALREIRVRRKLPEHFVFKHARTRPEIREIFFHELSRSELELFALVVNKRDWDEAYLRSSTGVDRIIDSIAELVMSMSTRLVDGQILLVDLPKAENALIGRIRTRLRSDLAFVGRVSFAKVKAVPDHRSEGFLVQAADMAAGALSTAEWINESCPARLRARMHLV